MVAARPGVPAHAVVVDVRRVERHVRHLDALARVHERGAAAARMVRTVRVRAVHQPVCVRVNTVAAVCVVGAIEIRFLGRVFRALQERRYARREQHGRENVQG